MLIIFSFSSVDFSSNGWRLSSGMFMSSNMSMKRRLISSPDSMSLCSSWASSSESDSADMGRPPFVDFFGRPNHMSSRPPPPLPDFVRSCLDILRSKCARALCTQMRDYLDLRVDWCVFFAQINCCCALVNTFAVSFASVT